jgi:hypothetical protein
MHREYVLYAGQMSARYKILVGNPKAKKPLARPGRRFG